MTRNVQLISKRFIIIAAAILSGLLSAGGLSAQADFLSYNFTLNPSYPETINTNAGTIEVEVYNSADVTNLIAVFTTSPNAVVRIGSVTQTSGQTVNNFSSQVTYLITSGDGTVTKEWTVRVVKREASLNKQLLSFQFASLGAVATINQTDHTVYVTVPYSQDVTALVATFTISPLATLKIGSTTLISGVTPYNYTTALEENGNTITLTVIAENASSRNYYISVRRAAPLTEKNITYFAFEALDPDIVGVIDQVNQTIAVTLPFHVSVTSLVASFTNSHLSTVKVGNTVQISGVTPNNFTSPLNYVVTAEDGSTKTYVVTVTKSNPSSEKQISSFVITNLDPDVSCTIDEANKTISAVVPYAADITGLIATYTVSLYTEVTVAGIAQVSGVTVNDFTTPVIYKVTAQDGSSQDYTVTITRAAASQENDMLSFLFEATKNDVLTSNAIGDIDNAQKTVTVEVPYGTDRSNMIPTFTSSQLSTVSISGVQQQSGVSAQNFSNPVPYTVTAEDGSSEIYMVSVNHKAASQENVLISFKFEASKNDDLAADAVGTIDQSAKTVLVRVPYGTDLSNLVASFIISEFARARIGTVTQVSGLTVNNFTTDLTYSIIAQDQSVELYTVTVVVDQNTEKRFHSFTFEGIDPVIVGTINEAAKTIVAQVPYSVDRSALIASFTVSDNAKVYLGTTRQFSGVTINDYSSPLTFTVEAENGSTQDYLVTVTNLPVQTGKLITDFRFSSFDPDVVADIDQLNRTIKAVVPRGTDLTTLVASFTHSYLSVVRIDGVRQVSGVTVNDFSEVITYRVTAEDGSIRDYTAIITEAPPSSEKDMLYFAFQAFNPVVVGNIDQSAQTINLTVPNGTNLTNLIASFTVSEYATVKVRDQGYQQSGITQNDFTDPLVYEVYAEDESMKDYVVIVTETADIVAPVVSCAAQTVTNELGQFVILQSNESTGKVYIIRSDSDQATPAELDAAVAAGRGKSAFVQSANQDIPVSTYTLPEGTYYAYAIDKAGNMSARGQNDITIIDNLPPTVYINSQTISNAPNHFVLAQASENNVLIYLIKEGEPQASKTQMDAAVAARNGAKTYAYEAFTNVSLLVSGLNPGSYRAYAIDQNDNISNPSTQVVIVIAASRLKSITSYGFLSTVPVSTGFISGTLIEVEVPEGTDVSSLVATFTVSDNAKAYIGLVEQVSGITSNDFTKPLTYTIEAEDGSTQDYVVTVTVRSGSGTGELEWENAVVVYPNPVSEVLNIRMDRMADRIIIRNISGLVLNDIDNPRGTIISLTTDDWAPGIYVISFIQQGESVLHKKILKQ